MERQYFLGLDIGTANIRAVQGILDDSGRVSVLGAASGLSSGLRRGQILDPEETVSAVSAVLEQVERTTGHSAGVSAVNIGGGGSIASIVSRGTVAVARPDGEIGDSDVNRALEAARAISIPSNREILHILPRMFIVDGQGGIPDPRGSAGIRLEVDACLVHSVASTLHSVQRLAGQAGLDDAHFVAGPLASGEAALSSRQRELGVAVVDIGHGTTGVAVYEEGEPLHVGIVPLGSGHVTNDLAIGLRCDIDTAERVKRLHGQAMTEEMERNDVIDLNKINPTEEGRVERREVVRIMEARLEEIFARVRLELQSCGRFGQLPAGVVLVGGGSAVQGIVTLAKRELALPAALGAARDVQAIVERVNDPAFSTAVGLLKYAIKQGGGSGRSSRLGKLWFSGQRVVQLKRWVQSLLP